MITIPPSVQAGAISGLLTAGAVDFQAFRNFKCWHDAAAYNWGTALFRWAQGAIMGAVTGAGIFAVNS